jgi:hypothetical protein
MYIRASVDTIIRGILGLLNVLMSLITILSAVNILRFKTVENLFIVCEGELRSCGSFPG